MGVDGPSTSKGGGFLINTRGSHLPLSHQRQILPIAQLKREVLYAVEKFQTTVLIGETGYDKQPNYLTAACGGEKPIKPIAFLTIVPVTG